MKNLVIGVDLGASYVRAGVVNKNGKFASFKKARSSTPENLLKFLKSFSKQKFSAIGIGTPGPLDLKNGSIGNTPNLISFKNCPIVKILKDEFGLPVFLERDTNVALLGEVWKGAATDVKNAVMLTLGTGVGGAILINGKLYHGEHGVGAEIGHMAIDPQGPVCSCGQNGHLEAYLGLAAVIRDYSIDHWELIERVEKGEERAIKISQKLGEILGEGLVNIVNIFDPQILIFGGGLAKLGETLTRPAEKIVEKKVLAKPLKTKIGSSKLGDFGGVIGAAKLVFSH